MNGCDICKERIARTGSAVEGVWEERERPSYWIWYDTHHNLDCEVHDMTALSNLLHNVAREREFSIKSEFDYGSAETEFTGTLEEAKRFAVAFTVGCANARVDARQTARSSS